MDEEEEEMRGEGGGRKISLTDGWRTNGKKKPGGEKKFGSQRTQDEKNRR